MIMSLLAGCESTYISTVKVPAPTTEEVGALSEQIKLLVRDLEYSDKVAEDFAEMALNWQDDSGRPAIAVWKKQLAQVRNEYAQGRISDDKLARFEQNALKELSQRIRKEIGSGDFFELGDIIEHKQAQSLGYSQLVYILANSVGLSAKPIAVQELPSGVSPARAGHTACLIKCANGTTAMVDLTWKSIETKPFILDNEFEKVGDFRELKNQNDPLKIHRRIQVLDKDEFLACIYNSRGLALSDAGRYSQAVSEYDKAIRLNPDLALAYNNRGSAHNKMGSYETAIADYNKAIELDPKLAIAYSNRASAFVDSGRFNKAINDCTKAVTLNPGLAAAYVTRASAYIEMEEYENAILDCNKAIELDPQLGRAYINRAICYAKSGNLKNAKNDLLYAVAWEPALTERAQTVNTKYDMGLSEQRISEWSEGMILVTPARYGVDVEIVGNPVDETSPKEQAHPEETSTYDKAADLSPKDASGYLRRGNAYYRLKQHIKAITDYNKALELNPDYVAAYYNRANSYASLGEFKQAKSDFLRAMELNPAIKPNVRKSCDVYKLNLEFD